jgi:hexosaminidase
MFYRFYGLLFMIFMVQVTDAQTIAKKSILPTVISPEVGVQIIPKPKSVTQSNNVFFNISKKTGIIVSKDEPEIQKIADLLSERVTIDQVKCLKIAAPQQTKKFENTIVLNRINDKSLGTEGYRIKTTAQSMVLEANQPIGFFYALQTVFQLLPSNIYAQKGQNQASWRIPAVQIEDMPRYAYRGMHLDVSRHFFPLTFVKKYIDLLAVHKMNTFHWHLTDDQGWRIEIKKYPKLTEIGSKRKETLLGSYADRPEKYDGKEYAGFYTQAEIREIVAYAKARYITVIPEIEMPGHALAALSAYPELSCDASKTYQAATKWGVFEDVFCPTEQTFAFLQDVLTEVIDLFPSKYIHIGGDECPKAAWKKSAFCQDLMKKEGLKDEHELQSYFVKRIEKYINSKGRKLLGWDEILEGGLAPDATVMSWRGTEGGIAAAKEGHDVVMTPGTHCYFDHYQADPTSEPLAIGGFTTLEKVYGFEPTPAELTPEQAKHILGAQANVWTEYMQTTDYVEYMAYPRACALAEVLWSSKENKSYDDFLGRLQTHFQRLKALNVNYAERIYDVTAQLTGGYKQTKVVLNQTVKSGEIRYSTNGTAPNMNATLYTQPFDIQKLTEIKAACFEGGKMISKVVSKTFNVHEATGLPYKCVVPPTNTYESGSTGLTNGLTGDVKNFAQWTGFNGNDMEVILDFDTARAFKSVGVSFLNKSLAWIFLPDYVILSVSEDGKTWKDVDRKDFNDKNMEKIEIRRADLAFPNVTSPKRFLKVFAKNIGKCPVGHAGAGQAAWLFADELIVE